MHHLIKHPALAVVAILVVAINFYVVTKPYSGSTYEFINSSSHSSMNVTSATADQNAESAEITQDYALATGAWIPPLTTVQSTVPDQNAESAEITQDYALATGAWIPPRPN